MDVGPLCFEVRGAVGYGGMRWIPAGHAGQPGMLISPRH
jgi:hypothetical protein